VLRCDEGVGEGEGARGALGNGSGRDQPRLRCRTCSHLKLKRRK
jgi:hypothetical protein